MAAFLDGLCRVILLVCCALAVVIVAALGVQIISRYVLNAPVHMTDAVAAGALIWMTFLGAAVVYRERGHIAIELIDMLPWNGAKRAVRLIIHLLVLAVLAFILQQVWQVRPLMLRVQFGTIPASTLTSKFVFVTLPFAVGAALTILFALEAILREFSGKR
ncbi:TRAP transporter small permease subunit [Chelativorans sp. AA-79]|uniref:TRAP transporter small permease n=1 Tax=Chelativorans sp. AA-79 TaxID=3028735 RepID=UPI0023F700BA|nr:TRAP transporter small permease subunit [Chelativorans sp. AA-79]WEX08277.1 TRAP transporter small permease subunit [Chelativorans sp. AA-79]